MNEGWCALALALMSPKFLMPEDAFESLSAGKIGNGNKNWDDVVPEMIWMRADGVPWGEIAEIYGHSKNTCMCMVNRYKKRLQRRQGVVA